jgi:hypothetical protein
LNNNFRRVKSKKNKTIYKSLDSEEEKNELSENEAETQTQNSHKLN